MHLCPRYITLCHPNSGEDNSAPPLQSKARVCVLQVKEPIRRSDTVGLCYIDKPLIHAFRGPKASGSSILSSKSVTKRFSEKLLLSFPINRAQLHCWSGFFRGRSKPSGPGWHCWSGCVASLALNQTGRGGTVGRSFFVFPIKCTYVPLPLSLEV